MSNFFEDSVKNPVAKWGEFKAGNDYGYFRFWDSNAEEGEELSNEDEIIFFPLYIHTGVVGFHKTEKKGIYSNEVNNNDSKLIVRTSNGIIAEGKWTDIKADVEKVNGKFAQVAYGFRIFKKGEERGHELVAIKFSGAALSGFFDANIRAGNKVAINMQKGELMKEGTNEFWNLKIKKYKKDEGLIKIALPYALELKEYFDYYFSQDDVNVTELGQPKSIQENSSNVSIDEINAQAAEASEANDPLLIASNVVGFEEINDLPV